MIEPVRLNTTFNQDAMNPQKMQARASDPATSVWVNASAGSGKTTVLTNRVIRLLLAGVRPERILCLTFTRAALIIKFVDRHGADRGDDQIQNLIHREIQSSASKLNLNPGRPEPVRLTFKTSGSYRYRSD